MKRLTLFLVLIFICTLFRAPSHAAIKKVAQTGLQFLKVDVGAGASAMGGAYTLVGSDASAVFYNPAGLSQMETNYDFFSNRTNWFADIAYNAGAFAMNLGNLGTFAIDYVGADYGKFIGTRVASTQKGFEETGNLDIGAYAVGVSYARALTNKFMIGGHVKYAAQHLGSNLMPEGETVENRVGGLAFDFGTIFYPGFKSFRFGMSVRDFSPQYKYEEYAFQLPLTFRIGMAMDMFDLIGGSQTNTLTVAFDAVHPRDYTERLHVGGEYWYMDMIALRAGYKFNYDEESLTAGIGFKSSVGGVDIKIGYSYADFDVFDAVNRFSLGLAF